MMGYKPVHFTDNYKYLGVTLDKGLNFQLHVKNVYNLAAHKIYLLGIIRPYLTIESALFVYKTKVLPYIDYGDILYHKTHKQAINKIQRLQNRALGICLKSPARTPSDQVHSTTGVPYLEFRRKAHLRNFMYSRKDDPKYLDTGRTNTHARDAALVKVIPPKSTVFERSVLYKAAIEWNNLDVGSRSIVNKAMFKAHQKRWLKDSVTLS